MLAATDVFLARFFLTAFIEEYIFQLRRRRTQKGIIPVIKAGMYKLQTWFSGKGGISILVSAELIEWAVFT